MDLEGNIALITGAGQGVGREIALSFAVHGAGGVAVNDLSADRAEQVAEEVRALGVPACAAPFDVGDLAAVQQGFDLALETLGPIDILVNNAGNSGPHAGLENLALFWQTDPEDWEPWIRPNLYGVFNCCHAALPGMAERRSGRVITVISDAGRVGEPRLAVYSAAKAGAAGLMRALAKELGKLGITANCVALGTIRTPFTESIFKTPGFAEKMSRRYMLPRLGEPEDAAELITFLASGAAGWITGQTYPVNGGYSVSV